MSRRPRYSRDLLGSVARWYYLHELSQVEIANRLDPPRDQATVARILREARDLGVIKIDIDPDYAIHGVEDDHLADRMRDEFELRDPIVIDSTMLGQHAGVGASDDILHFALANHAGVLLRSGINSGEHIAVSGGRAGVRVATVIGRNPPSRRNITVTPLSGRLWNGRLWEIGGNMTHLEQPLNADYSALILAVGMYNGHAPGIKFSQISHPLYVEDRPQAEKIMREYCAFLPDGGWNWELQPPTRAFCGVGVVDPNSRHRIALNLKHQISTDQVLSQLKTVQKFISDNHLPYFGDVANRLFAALPLPSDFADASADLLRKQMRLYRRTIDRLNAVNVKSVVMRWDHLRQIPSVLAVSGGPYKVNVLWSLLLAGLLHPESRVITDLATDSETAKVLLRAKRDYEKTAARVQAWYRTIVREIFQDPAAGESSRGDQLQHFSRRTR